MADKLKLSKKVIKLVKQDRTLEAGDRFYKENETGSYDKDLEILKIANTIRFNNDVIKKIKDGK